MPPDIFARVRAPLLVAAVALAIGFLVPAVQGMNAPTSPEGLTAADTHLSPTPVGGWGSDGAVTGADLTTFLDGRVAGDSPSPSESARETLASEQPAPTAQGTATVLTAPGTPAPERTAPTPTPAPAVPASSEAQATATPSATPTAPPSGQPSETGDSGMCTGVEPLPTICLPTPEP